MNEATQEHRDSRQAVTEFLRKQPQESDAAMRDYVRNVWEKWNKEPQVDVRPNCPPAQD